MNATQTSRRWNPLVWVLAALTVLTVLALAAAVAWRTGASNTPDSGAGSRIRTGTNQPGVGTRPGLDLYPLNKRVPAANLQGTTLDAKPFDLTHLAGKIVVINVWGSWCAPCRAETPELVRVANEKADQGVRFVGIDTRDNHAAAKAFTRNLKVPYPSVEDPQGQVLLAFRGTVPTSVVPSTIVIDRQGRVAARIIGPVTYTTLIGILDDEIAAGGSR